MASKRLTPDLISNFYRPQMKFGRGNVFTPVTLFTGGRSLPMEGLPPGGGGSAPRGRGVLHLGRDLPRGGLHPGRGGSASRERGVCIQAGGGFGRPTPRN